jgi:hypothetical protein
MIRNVGTYKNSDTSWSFDNGLTSLSQYPEDEGSAHLRKVGYF